MMIRTPHLLATLGAGLVAANTAHAQEIARAIGPVDGVGGLNLISYTNPYQNTLPGFEFDSTFTAGTDGFNIYIRGTSSIVPFVFADDSISVFPADTQGIVDETDMAPFFGITDTVNPDTGEESPITLSAMWEFDISSATADVEVSVDMAAMGDFEGPNVAFGFEDMYSFSYSLDGGPLISLAATTFNDTGDLEDDSGPSGLPGLDYTLAGGGVFTLNDFLSLNGTPLNNNFATFSLGTIPGSADASTITIQFDALSDSGSEAVAFRNLSISEAADGVLGDTDGDGDVDDFDLLNAISNFTGSLAAGTGGKGVPEGDTDTDADVDDFDLLNMISGFTGSLSSPVVPEPGSLALLGLGGVLVAGRRRRA